jgi:hypothetical protein
MNAALLTSPEHAWISLVTGHTERNNTWVVFKPQRVFFDHRLAMVSNGFYELD